MSKKLLVALATVAALAGFGTLAGSSPAEAQMYGPPGHHFRPPPPPPSHFHRPPPPVWHAPRTHYAPRIYVAPAPLYVEDCRIIRKRERVLTDRGWRWRYRNVRYCD